MLTKKTITIAEVASKAGVSTQTASRVLNKRPDVSPETRKLVEEVIFQLGYQPNAIARGLASKRTRTLGLITADFSDYFFTEVVAGAEAEARKQDYFFMLGTTERNPRDEPEYIRLLTERHVEGILFARPSTEPHSEHLLDLVRQGIPLVTTAYHLPGEMLTVVDVDNEDGGFQATQHLIERGHRHIAMITGPMTWKSVKDRTRGFRLALETAGRVANINLIAEGNWSYLSGYQAMQELLIKSQEFSAVFAQNDQMAIGAMRALREVGLRIPHDVSIVGYDDIPAAEYSDPPLTTIKQPMRQVGEIATQLLIQSIEKVKVTGGEVLLKGILVERESVA